MTAQRAPCSLFSALLAFSVASCTVEVYLQERIITGCGNGFVDPGEVCDDGNLLGGGYLVDGDGCSANCLSVEVCGNGLRDLVRGEECDAGGESADCDLDCTLARCGDGTTNLTASEACDDGNAVDGDGCERDCTLTP
jgi:cysteine-rich repeat protein